ncbi:MAG TPA: hypothetical protein PKX14_00645, partial [Thauera aminoaromatica]|nr:hypothetical protein [Thauera aminoaromatica]HNF75269.1 hypothetical protein [Thauera aminoaromatica]
PLPDAGTRPTRTPHAIELKNKFTHPRKSVYLAARSRFKQWLLVWLPACSKRTRVGLMPP